MVSLQSIMPKADMQKTKYKNTYAAKSLWAIPNKILVNLFRQYHEAFDPGGRKFSSMLVRLEYG